MNGLFYLALERLPLGVTVTIEVLGPLTLSIVVARSRSAWLWAGLALLGVLALGGGGWDRLDPLGCSSRSARRRAGRSTSSPRRRSVGRSGSSTGWRSRWRSARMLALPFGIVAAGEALLRPVILGLGAAVAVLSSTIPYALELIALRRLAAAAFAILMSLSPATAALAGFLILGQTLTWLEIVGMALVIAASVGAVRAARRRAGEAERGGADAATLAEPLA